MSSSEVFKLKPDNGNIHDEEYDAVNIDQGKYNMLPSRLLGVRNVELPAAMHFATNFSMISKKDFLVNDMSIPIIHQQVLLRNH